MKIRFYYFIVIQTLLNLSGCVDISQSSNLDNQNFDYPNKDLKTIDGSYSYRDASAELTIQVYGDTWSGTTKILSGLGDEYDNQNVEFSSGIVKDNDLYESSGNSKIGHISGNLLTTSIGGSSVTLTKD